MAITYDKYAHVHCQSLCVYREPETCLHEQIQEAEAEKPCDRDASGRTAVQQMYSSTRGSKERSGQRSVLDGLFE